MDKPKSKLTDTITTETVSSDLDALKAAVAQLTEQFSQYVAEEKTTLSHFLSREAKHAKQALDEKLGDVGARASDYADIAKSQASDLHKTTLDYVAKKPLQSLAIAAGIGLVLGLLSKGRA